MKTIKAPISSLKPDPENARKHNAKNLKAITSSLKKFGQVEPILVHKKSRVVIAGNGRLEAMKALGWTDVEIVELDITKKQATALAIALNRSSELGEWDRDVAGPLLASLHSEGFDLEELGFSFDDLHVLFDLDLNIDKVIESQTAAVPEGSSSDLDEGEVKVTVRDPDVKFSRYIGEANNYIVLAFYNEVDWLNAMTHFNLPSNYSSRKGGKPWSRGIGRVVNGAAYLTSIQAEASDGK